MTESSPSGIICLVTGIGPAAAMTAAGAARLPLGDALDAIRRGQLGLAVVADARPEAFGLLLEAGASARRRAVIALAELRGHALTASRSPVDDPLDLQPARAIRRALANGRMSAREVGYIAAIGAGPGARERAAHAVARGLGRYAAGTAADLVDIADVAGEHPPGEPGLAAAKCVIAIALGTPAARAMLEEMGPLVSALVGQLRSRLTTGPVGGAVALSIDPDGSNVALAFSRPR